MKTLSTIATILALLISTVNAAPIMHLDRSAPIPQDISAAQKTISNKDWAMTKRSIPSDNNFNTQKLLIPVDWSEVEKNIVDGEVFVKDKHVYPTRPSGPTA